MKVCFIVSTYEPNTTGGQSEVVFRLQENLHRRSIDAYVFTEGSPVPGYPRTVRTGSGNRLFYVVSAAYLNWFRKMDFDIINIHQDSGLGIVPFLVASRSRAKIVTTMHCSYLYEWNSIRRLGGFPTQEAAPTFDEYVKKYLLTPIKFFGSYLDCIVSDKIVAVCAKTKDDCMAEFGIPTEKITVIYNGVNLTEFSPVVARTKIRNKYLLGDRPLILSVGCATMRKGIPCLLQSISEVKAQIPDVRLVVTGPTRYKEQLLSISRDLGIEENVILSGKVTREELPFYYSGCDVVAMPSLGGEGFPMVILEAMASGKPVVASRVGGIPEVIKSGSNGILFEPGNISQLTSAMVTLLQDKKLRREMGTKARLEAEMKYDWRNITDSYIAEFKNVM